MKNFIKVVATITILVIFGVMPVSAAEINSIADETIYAEIPYSNNSSMEIINYTEVFNSADVNSDSCVNILDLIMAKNSSTTGQQILVKDVLFGNEVSKSCYDLDEITVNPNKTNVFEQFFGKNDRPVDVYQLENSAVIAEFYNPAEHVLKRFKLERFYGIDDNANKYMEFISKCNLPLSNEMAVCYLSISKLGKIGWSDDSFKSKPSKKVYELDKMESSISNIALLKSILCGCDYDERICLNDNNITEVIYRNKERDVIFRTETTGVPIENWFFRCGQSYGYGSYQNFIFGITADGKLNINYEC